MDGSCDYRVTLYALHIFTSHDAPCPLRRKRQWRGIKMFDKFQRAKPHIRLGKVGVSGTLLHGRGLTAMVLSARLLRDRAIYLVQIKISRLKKLRILGPALWLISTQAVAQDATTIADVRCIVVGMHIAGTGTPEQQSTGAFMTL
jgi:hypothetical protein